MKNQAHAISEEIKPILLFIAVIWGIFLLDRFLPLETFGLLPRSLSHITGIIAMPFLHGDLSHIVSNTVPLLVLLSLLAGSKANSKFIVLAIILLGGALLWFFGRGHAIHIGASGLVFGLATFLIVAGILEKRLVPMAISILVGGFYGSSLLAGVLPMQKGVSWDGHLTGAIAGAIIAWGVLRLGRFEDLDQTVV